MINVECASGLIHEKGSKVSTANARGMALPPQLRQAGRSGLQQEELQAGSLDCQETQGLPTLGLKGSASPGISFIFLTGPKSRGGWMTSAFLTHLI